MHTELSETIYTVVCRAIREHDPAAFARGERWKPAGIAELQDRMIGLIHAVRQSSPRHPVDLQSTVCRGCEHQTACGYCLHRDNGNCILQKHLPTILAVVRDAVSHAAA